MKSRIREKQRQRQGVEAMTLINVEKNLSNSFLMSIISTLTGYGASVEALRIGKQIGEQNKTKQNKKEKTVKK